MSILRTALMKRALPSLQMNIHYLDEKYNTNCNASKSPWIRPVDQCAFHEYASVFEFSILVGFHLSNISIVIRLCVFHFNFTVIVVLKLIKYVFQPRMSVMFACLHGICSKLSESLALFKGERGGSVVECQTPEREVRGSRPTAAVLCPWARHFTPRKYWLITQEAMAPSRHDWKIVDWDVKPQHNQPTKALFKIIR